MAQIMAKQKNVYILFLDTLSFCVKDPPPYLQQGGHKMTVILYIYLYIEKFEVVWELNGSKYGKTKTTCVPYFWILYLFVWKTHLRISNRVAIKWPLFYIYIYTYICRSSRLREYWRAQYIAKHKNTYTLFFDSLSFCVKDPPLYLQQGGH